MIQMENNPMSHERAKHIDIYYHFMREHVVLNFIKLIHIFSKYRLTDPLTNALPRNLFHYLIDKLRFCNIYLAT